MVFDWAMVEMFWVVDELEEDTGVNKPGSLCGKP